MSSNHWHRFILPSLFPESLVILFFKIAKLLAFLEYQFAQIQLTNLLVNFHFHMRNYLTVNHKTIPILELLKTTKYCYSKLLITIQRLKEFEVMKNLQKLHFPVLYFNLWMHYY